MLGGEPYGRPNRAAELFKAGAAPLIIVSGEGDCLELTRALKVNGVPESAIRTECESRNTKENAEFTVRLLKDGDGSRKVERFESGKVGETTDHRPLTTGGLNAGRSEGGTTSNLHIGDFASSDVPTFAPSQSAIIVTSWYHSRRALKCFQKAAPDLRFYSRPSYYALARPEWQPTGTSPHIRAEFIKIPAYAILYGIWPW